MHLKSVFSVFNFVILFHFQSRRFLLPLRALLPTGILTVEGDVRTCCCLILDRRRWEKGIMGVRGRHRGEAERRYWNDLVFVWRRSFVVSSESLTHFSQIIVKKKEGIDLYLWGKTFGSFLHCFGEQFRATAAPAGKRGRRVGCRREPEHKTIFEDGECCKEHSKK